MKGIVSIIALDFISRKLGIDSEIIMAMLTELDISSLPKLDDISIEKMAKLQPKGDFLHKYLNRVSVDTYEENIHLEFGSFLFKMCTVYFGIKFFMIGPTVHDFLNNITEALLYFTSIYGTEGIILENVKCMEKNKSTLLISLSVSEFINEPIVRGFLTEMWREKMNGTPDFVLEKDWTEIDHTIVYNVYSSEYIVKPQIDDDGSTISDEGMNEFMSKSTISNLVPFYFIVSQAGSILEMGDRLTELVSVQDEDELVAKNVFNILEPAEMTFDFNTISQYKSNLVVITLKEEVLPKNKKCSEIFKLYGEMIKLESVDAYWFVGYPRFETLEQLVRSDLYISDLPNQGNSRALVMMNEQQKIIGNQQVQQQKMREALERLQRDLKNETKNTMRLLNEIFPKEVAVKLVNGEAADSKNIENAFIMFSDIVGFTKISSTASVLKITQMLNELFTKFDDLCSQMNLFKIETIGDAYVASSGVHEKQSDDAERIVRFGIKIIEFANSVKDPHGNKINIRVGIHCGDVVAGIVGNRSPRYCLFGNTVQLANKIESLSEPNRVSISSGLKSVLEKIECTGLNLEEHIYCPEIGMLFLVSEIS